MARVEEGILPEDGVSVKEDARYKRVDIHSLKTNDAKTISAEHAAILVGKRYQN